VRHPKTLATLLAATLSSFLAVPGHAATLSPQGAAANRTMAALAKMQNGLLVQPDSDLLVLTASEAIRSNASDLAAFDACTAAVVLSPEQDPNYPANYAPIRRAFACLARSKATPEQLDAASDQAVRSAMARFDPAGRWLNQADIESLLKPAAGIGVALKQTADGPLVVSAAETAPGYLAGIRRGDHFLAIDGKPVENDALEPVISAIKGEVGSQFTVRVRHQDASVADLVMTRNVVTPQFFKVEVEREGQILRLTVPQMTTGIAQQVRDALSAQTLPVGLLVLDLRYNSGGLLDEAIALADAFLGKVDIASVVERDSKNNELYRSRSEQINAAVPMVVWVDQVTASGAEIVAAALQDTGRAKVVGQTTFGFGRIHTLIPVDRGHVLKLTTGQVLRANGKPLADTHVKPDCPADPERLTISAMTGFMSKSSEAPCPELPQSAPLPKPAFARQPD
jgi:carboxyl-terminal processing protease